MVVVAKEAVRVLAFAADAFVGDTNGELATPLHLPVMTEATKGLRAQDLGQTGHVPELQSRIFKPNLIKTFKLKLEKQNKSSNLDFVFVSL